MRPFFHSSQMPRTRPATRAVRQQRNRHLAERDQKDVYPAGKQRRQQKREENFARGLQPAAAARGRALFQLAMDAEQPCMRALGGDPVIEKEHATDERDQQHGVGARFAVTRQNAGADLQINFSGENLDARRQADESGNLESLEGTHEGKNQHRQHARERERKRDLGKHLPIAAARRRSRLFQRRIHRAKRSRHQKEDHRSPDEALDQKSSHPRSCA